MSGTVTLDGGAWAFGPVGSPGTRTRLRPVGLAAGVLAGLGLAVGIGFVAFVMIAGSDDAVSPATSAPAPVTAVEPGVAADPFLLTDLRLTTTVDAMTGEPADQTNSFGIGEPVQLWLSFEAGEHTAPLTAVWFRGENKIARLTAPLPDAASQMVFPLPQVAMDRPGEYRVEVRSAGDVLAAESFEVTNG